MAIFAISFRLEYDSTYSTRWDDVQEKIKEKVGTNYWCQTTSFYIVSCSGTASELDSYIYLKSKLHSGDLMVVINLSDKSDYSIRGPYTDKDVDKLLKAR